MKKFLAILLAAMLVLSLSAAAFAADDTDATSYTIDDMDPDLYEGVWVNLADVLNIYLPGEWNEIDLEAADLGEDTIYAVCDDDMEHYMYLQYLNKDEVNELVTGGFASSDELVEELVAEGYDSASIYYLNDIETVFYTDTENDAAHVIILGDNGGLFNFGFSPISDEEFQDYICNMIYSISLPEDADASSAA